MSTTNMSSTATSASSSHYEAYVVGVMAALLVAVCLGRVAVRYRQRKLELVEDGDEATRL